MEYMVVRVDLSGLGRRERSLLTQLMTAHSLSERASISFRGRAFELPPGSFVGPSPRTPAELVENIRDALERALKQKPPRVIAAYLEQVCRVDAASRQRLRA